LKPIRQKFRMVEYVEVLFCSTCQHELDMLEDIRVIDKILGPRQRHIYRCGKCEKTCSHSGVYPEYTQSLELQK